MKFGVCCSVEEAPRILDAGFDYIEVAAVGFNGLREEWYPSAFRGLPIEATNVFFPGEIRLFGPEKVEWFEYAKRTIERAAMLGVKVMVVGSGGARRSLDGVDRDEEFAKVASRLQRWAKKHKVTIAPESLNRTETNVGNDLRRLAMQLRHEECTYTADSYHVLYEWDADGRLQDLEALWCEQIPYAPAHVHLATLEGRAAPKPDDPLLDGFKRRLHDLRYDARVSLECACPEGFDYKQALADVKSLFLM